MKNNKNLNISSNDIKRAYLQAAQVVSIYGEKYLPIFERIEKEYLKQKQKMATLRRIDEIAVDKNI